MMTEKIDEMIAALESIKADADKFENKAVNTAGTRINKVMMEVANNAKAMRKLVSTIRTDRKAQKANK